MPAGWDGSQGAPQGFNLPALMRYTPGRRLNRGEVYWKLPSPRFEPGVTLVLVFGGRSDTGEKSSRSTAP